MGDDRFFRPPLTVSHVHDGMGLPIIHDESVCHDTQALKASHLS
jgi:hypothetical protein